MARSFDSVKDITDLKDLWKLAVRIEDLWSVYSKTKEEHLEFILLDKQGGQIQVYLPNDLVEQWKPKLKEGHTYVMSNFKVQKNDFAYKSCVHDFKLIFNAGTRVTAKDIPDIPNYKFNFKSFSEINVVNYKPDLLYDVIGAFKQMNYSQQVVGARKICAAFNIVDLSGDELCCTLWGDFASSLFIYLSLRSNNEPIIITIKHGKIKDGTEGYPVAIGNAWNGTKLYIDASFDEVKKFRMSFNPEFLTAINGVGNNSSLMITQGSTSSQSSFGDRFLVGAPVIHLSELMNLPENTICITVATTRKILTSKYGWYYLECEKCSKKCDGIAPPYKCSSDHESTKPVIRYKLEVEVINGPHRVTFIFWDQDASELIGCTAADLRQIMIDAGEDDPLEYPEKLDNFMNKTYAFRVKAQPKFKKASVLGVRSDADTISKVDDQFPPNDNTSKLIKSTPDIDENTCSAADGTDTSDTANASQILPILTVSLSDSADTYPDNNTNITPKKRICTSVPEPQIATQESASVKKYSARFKQVKKE